MISFIILPGFVHTIWYVPIYSDIKYLLFILVYDARFTIRRSIM